MLPAQAFVNSQGCTRTEFELYGRQLLLPEIGIRGQARLKESVVTLVGAGGLGSPAALYLATAGIGRLRIVDGDEVATSNLHRQVIHTLANVGQNKANSAAAQCAARNPHVQVEAIASFFTPSNALDLLKGSTVVVDATDNARTRYLINEACVELGKPLVSGSALRWEGQLSVFNYTKGGIKGPCYRCVFPAIPTLNNANACDMEGVIGPAPGIIGTMQALEALKVCIGIEDAVLSGRLLLLDCLNPSRMWRSVLMKGRRDGCQSCSTTRNEFPASLPICPDEVYPSLSADQTIAPISFFHDALLCTSDQGVASLMVRPSSNGSVHVVVDVRRPNHFSLVHIQGSVNFPIDIFIERSKGVLEERDAASQGEKVLEFVEELLNAKPVAAATIYCLCRRGRDAAKAVASLSAVLRSAQSVLPSISCVNVVGGMMGLVAAVPELVHFPVT